jgi:primosomal protein N' (replication factor Y)
MTVELQVAVATPLYKIFTYSHSEPLAPGVRVLVPFGASPKTLGVIVDGANPPSLQTPKDERSFKLKPITKVLDQEPVYSQTLLRLAQWLATYYMHPLGEVLRTMLPASAKKSTKLTFELTDAGSRAPDDDDLRPGSLFARKKTITHATLKKKLVERGLSASQIDDLLKSWSKKKWIEPYREKSIRTREHLSQTQKSETAPSIQSDLFRELNHHQQLAVSKIITDGLSQQNQALRKPFLIFGVTGSGKTEVFLSAIKSVLEQPLGPKDLQAQALVLVPEISLTPQMTRIFEERFPGKVAVVHSAMDDNER